jgi:N-acetylneuraminate synthase
MIKPLKIKDHVLEDFQPPFFIAEIGINHNGSLETAFRLIDEAKAAGFDAVKFQKRTVEIVYSPEELAKPRTSPFGETNGDLKRGLEFGKKEYDAIDQYCKEKEILWFASAWDVESIKFLQQYDLPAIKVASASLTDGDLLDASKALGIPVLLSTGMSTVEQIDVAVNRLEGAELALMHTTSTYPSQDDELNLAVIQTLRERYQLPIGYSGHEVGVMPSVYAVVAYGACCIERHITLNRAMWGSDQAASLEPDGMRRLIKNVKLWHTAKGDGVKRLYDSEVPVMLKLRRV